MVLVFKVYNAQDYPDAGDVEARVRRMAAERGVEADVRWLFDVAPDDLPGLYSFADVVLNYPSVDAFPVTFIEAAACQCPVISIDLPAYRGTFASEFFRMVPADDPSELVRAMVDQVLADPLASRQILGPARDLVVAEFDEKMSGDRLLNYYRSVLQA
jgi:glycosyltransferase involved in cell wall biosynthesis